MAEFTLSPALFWFLVGIAFLVAEMLIPGFILFFFGIGAWCTTLALWAWDLSGDKQLLVFLIGSIISLIALRSQLKKLFFRAQTHDTEELFQESSIQGTVTEDIIPPACGKVKFAGSFWQAIADEQISVGTVVTVVERKDLQVKVHPLKRQGEE